MTAGAESRSLVKVTPAGPTDVQALVTLLEEMDRFYGATEFEPLERRVAQVKEALFTNSPSAWALLAWDGDQLVGLATYSFLWPAVGLTRSLYLKELYVAQTHRRRGVGRLLMQQIFDVAVQTQCSRVEWATDDNNPVAQRFYAQLGYRTFLSKVSYRVEGEAALRSHLGDGPML